MDCKLCEFQHDILKKLTNHIRFEHGLSSEDYTTKVYHGGIKPVCKVCQAPVRYVSFSFKVFCKDHSQVTDGDKKYPGLRLVVARRDFATGGKDSAEINIS